MQLFCFKNLCGRVGKADSEDLMRKFALFQRFETAM